MATVRRPDLERIPVSRPDFIGQQIAPPQTVMGLAGTAYYDDIVSDQTAQQNRSAGSAITSAYVSVASQAYSIAPIERRAKAEDYRVPLLGGLVRAETKLARVSIRSVYAVHEALVAAAVLAQASPGGSANIGSSLIGAIDTGKATIEDYGAMGRIALVGSRKVVQRVKRYSEVTDRMVFTGVPTSDLRDVRNISDQQLAAALGVDVVLAGKNSIWYSGAAVYEQRLALVILPDPAMDADEEIQAFRTLSFPVDGAEGGLQVQSYFDDDLTSYVVQARLYQQLNTYNPELVYLLKGVDESNAVTSGTTATDA
jgi:hypothetical protein